MFKTLRTAAALALALCCAIAADRAQAQTRMSTVTGPGDVRLLVAEAGDPSKPGILFIHGFAQSHLSFRRQFESDLAKRYHLVAFDLRGHGGSDKPTTAADYKDTALWAGDVAAVIKATGLKRPVIVGWSYGGFVAMDYVRHHGVAGIAGVNLVGSLGGMPGAPPSSSMGDSPAAKAIRANGERARSLNLLDNILAGQATAAGFVTPNMTQQEKDILFATEMMMPAYTRRLMGARSYDNAAAVPMLTVPVLFSRGSRDVTMAPPAMAKLVAALPKARVSAYDDSGHLVFVEHVDRFNSELAAFVDASGAR